MSNYIFIVSAPSGTGKSSLLRAFLETQLGKNFAITTSHTTRKLRHGEINGKEYYFICDSEFNNMLAEDGFIEYAKVFGNYYGTSKFELDRLFNTGKNIILDIDWQGAQQTEKIYKDRVKSLFILPPSMAELRRRLESRNTDSKATIDYRMQQAQAEISHADEYDFRLVNDNFTQTLAQMSKYFQENIQV